MKTKINTRLRDTVKRRRDIAVKIAAFEICAAALKPFTPDTQITAMRALIANTITMKPKPLGQIAYEAFYPKFKPYTEWSKMDQEDSEPFIRVGRAVAREVKRRGRKAK